MLYPDGLFLIPAVPASGTEILHQRYCGQDQNDDDQRADRAHAPRHCVIPFIMHHLVLLTAREVENFLTVSVRQGHRREGFSRSHHRDFGPP